MAFFIPPNTFLGVAKLHAFTIKILGTLGDALSCYFYYIVAISEWFLYKKYK